MEIKFDTLSCIILPIIGYLTMVWMKKKANKAIKQQVFAEGFYRLKPVYGERAITLARSYARAGVLIFIFCIVLPIIFTVMAVI